MLFDESYTSIACASVSVCCWLRGVFSGTATKRLTYLLQPRVRVEMVLILDV